MSSVRLSVDRREFDKLMSNFPRVISNTVLKASLFLTGELKKTNPKDTGRSANAWQIIRKGLNEIEVVNGVFYVPFINYGTGIYGPKKARITAKQAKFLKFTIGSKTIYRKSVKGQKGTMFIEKSITKTEKNVEMFLQQELARI